jgi:type I restriction enzyme R subunit
VLRHGLKHGPHHLDLFYGTPSPGNAKAAERFAANRFSVTRQLRYSRDETQRALDLGLFINGLPVATFELKNSLTKQTVADAVEQYQRDRDPREKLFEFGRCVVHFAVDDHEVRFCTQLKGKGSWFLPFNQGWNDGAGNPPNPNGLKTDYLWKRVLTPHGPDRHPRELRAGRRDQGREDRQEEGGADLAALPPARRGAQAARRRAGNGAGKRYLIQHSAGSGKSNSIAWLAHQLIGLKKDEATVFDSIIVVTDRGSSTSRSATHQAVRPGRGHRRARRALGRPAQVHRRGQEDHHLHGAEVPVHPRRDRRRAPRAALRDRHRRGALEPGRQDLGRAAMAMALSEAPRRTTRRSRTDQPLMEAKKLLPNASYFAFTATPKNKTLEIFGEPDPQADGTVKHRPFHSYTMKQAIQEGFILDVLKHYTPVESYYKLVKKVEGDPEFDTKRAKKKLRRYVESHDHAIRLKAEIMVDHFHEQVLALNKIGGRRGRWW